MRKNNKDVRKPFRATTTTTTSSSSSSIETLKEINKQLKLDLSEAYTLLAEARKFVLKLKKDTQAMTKPNKAVRKPSGVKRPFLK